MLNQYLVLLNFLDWFRIYIYFYHLQSAMQYMFPSSLYSTQESLSDTRWACRQSAISTICYTFDAVVSTLIKVTDDGDGSRAAEARGLLLQVKSFRFILLLVIFDRLLTCSKGLSDLLQSTKIDLGKASNLVQPLIQLKFFNQTQNGRRCWHIAKMLQSNMMFL